MCRRRYSVHTTNGNTFDSAHAHARPLALDVAVNISLDALGAGSAAVLGEASAEAGVPLVEEGGIQVLILVILVPAAATG